MVWSTNSQDSIGSPCGARTGIVRAPHGNHQCFSYPTGPVRGPCGTRKGAIRQSCGDARELTQPELAKLPHGRRIWPYGPRTGPLRAPQGLFMGCLQYLNPYGARKLIMHALKLYGPRTGRQNLYGAARAPWVDVRFLFKTAREQPVRGPGVWCDWGISPRTGSRNQSRPRSPPRRIHQWQISGKPYLQEYGRLHRSNIHGEFDSAVEKNQIGVAIWVKKTVGSKKSGEVVAKKEELLIQIWRNVGIQFLAC